MGWPENEDNWGMCPVNEGGQVPGLAQWAGCDWGDQVVTDHVMAPKELRPHHSLVRLSPSSMPCRPPSHSTPAIPLVRTVPVVRGIPVVQRCPPRSRHPHRSHTVPIVRGIPVVHVLPRRSRAVPTLSPSFMLERNYPERLDGSTE